MRIRYSKLFVGISLPALCTGLASLLLFTSANAQTIRPSTQKELKVFDPTTNGTGNIGLRAAAGTSSYTLTLPASAPSVNQVLSASAVTGGNVSLTWATPFTGSGTTNYVSKFATAGTLTNSLLFDNGTNVGIGTSSPVTRLQVDAASGTTSSTVLTINGSHTGFVGDNDANTAYSINFDGTSFSWASGIAQRTGAQIQMLKQGTWNQDAAGAVGGTYASLVFKTNNGTIASPSLQERMRITSGGEVYIGNNPADQGAYNLQVNGTGVWGAGAYINGSDSALKYNIQPLEPSLDIVKQMNPVTFDYQPFYSKDTATQTGFIAQDLQILLADKVYKNGIVKEGGAYLGVAYENIIPLLVKAIQEQQKIIDQLKADQVNALLQLRQLQNEIQSMRKNQTPHHP